MDAKHTVDDFNLLMLCGLANQTESYLYMIKDKPYIRHEFKFRLNAMINSYKMFREYIQKHIDINELDDDSECFSRALEMIKKADTFEAKNKLFQLLKEFTEGETIQVDCEPHELMTKTEVIEFIQSTNKSMNAELIGKMFDNFKLKKNATI